MASYGSLKKNCPVLNSLCKENREIQGNKFRPDGQVSALKKGPQSLIRGENPLPATGRSMTEGGGPSVTEVATSFPARLLGAIKELRKF